MIYKTPSTDTAWALALARISQNLIQNLPARTARENFREICLYIEKFAYLYAPPASTSTGRVTRLTILPIPPTSLSLRLVLATTHPPLTSCRLQQIPALIVAEHERRLDHVRYSTTALCASSNISLSNEKTRSMAAELR